MESPYLLINTAKADVNVAEDTGEGTMGKQFQENGRRQVKTEEDG